MSDDEEDYMSDKFLSGSADIRPSLIQDRGKKREVAVEVKKSEHIKKQRMEWAEKKGLNANQRLQEALQRPIEAENKGFKLLAKMGYKPGQALGKDKTVESASSQQPLIEPIGISIKSDRGGLGRDAALRELSEKRMRLREQRLRRGTESEVTAEDFRRRAAQKAEERFMCGALRRCQLSCESLDIQFNVDTPEISWFWPERKAEIEEEDAGISKEDNSASNKELNELTTEDAEEYTATEKVEMLTDYLRTSYKFCFWCGVRYENQDDLESSCPGRTRDDH